MAKAPRADLVAAELQRRAAEAKRLAEKPKFSIDEHCFAEQAAFIKDPAKRKTGVTSRRAGKTEGCAADLQDTTERLEGDVAYITLSRKTAKKIIWKQLLKINKDYQMNAHIDNSELTITKPNGNTIHVSGAKDATEIEKFRGMKFRKVYIDESQSFRPYIKDLIEDVLEPCLTDYDGSLILTGTPPPVPTGYFHDCAHNPLWSHHHWTMMQNPHIKRLSGKEPMQIIQELAARRGLPMDHPNIVREYFGRWVKDTESLVYGFNPLINVIQPDKLPPLHKMTFIFGVDIGWKDSDAIAVLGYDNESQNAYLVEEYIKNKNDITALVQQIEKMRAKYNPVRIVMDAGALGKKIQAEIVSRHAIPVEAAEKHRKLEFIKLLNDDLRTGKFKAVPKTRFEEDAGLVQWDWSDPAKPKIDDRYHTDIGDAVLYAWRDCKHYFYTPAAATPTQGTNEYMEALEAQEAEKLAEKMAGGGTEQFTDVESWDDLGIGDFDEEF